MRVLRRRARGRRVVRRRAGLSLGIAVGQLLRERVLGREAVDREQLAALRVRRDVGVGEHCLLRRRDRCRARRARRVRDGPGGSRRGNGGCRSRLGRRAAALSSSSASWGPGRPPRAASSTHSPIATFFCLAFLAFRGSTRFAIRDSPPLQLVRRPAQVPVSLHSDLPAASAASAGAPALAGTSLP